MNIFIIPSWYPSPNALNAGVFFREQATVYARCFPQDQVALSHWGQSDERLLLEGKQIYQWPGKWIASKGIQPEKVLLSTNCHHYFRPAMTWSRRMFRGNLKGIVEACIENHKSFSRQYGKPDIFHAHVAFPGGYVARELSRRFGIPYVVTEHMSPFPMSGLKWKFDRYALAPLKAANKVIAVSKGLATEMEVYGVGSEVISNFIDDQFFSLSEITRPQKNFRFLSVGRLEEQKGYKYLLEACKRLKQKSITFELNIIGEGNLKERLHNLISRYNLSDFVRLMGLRNKEEIRDSLQNCDAFVLPSVHESFGIAPLEALACGRPILVSDVGEMGNMTSEKTGILVQPRDAKNLLEAMIQMMETRENYDSKQIRAYYEKKYASTLATSALRKVYKEITAS